MKIIFFVQKLRWSALKIVGPWKKGVGVCEKADGTRENVIGASEKCRILRKNLQELPKNKKIPPSCATEY
jgi:hypothetical protein